MCALLRVTACIAVIAAAASALSGCNEARAIRRQQADLEARVARLERGFAALSHDRPREPEITAGSGATAAPPPLAPSAPALDPIAAAAGPPRYALHLASYKRVADVRRGWTLLSRRAPAVLGGLSPQVEAVDFGDGRGSFFRLKAASFSDRAVAQSACDRLHASRLYCEVQDDAGTPGDQFWSAAAVP